MTDTASPPVVLRVFGMAGGGCARRVERALCKVSGVRQASVNLLTETARISPEHDVPLDATFAQTLVRAIRSVGYDSESLPQVRDADIGLHATSFAEPMRRHRQACLQAIGLSLPILALELFGSRLQAGHVAGALGWRILQAALTIMLLVGPAAGPTLVGGLRGLLHRAANADLLIALGLLAATLSSIAGTLTLRGELIRFDDVAWIVMITAVGRLFETRARAALLRGAASPVVAVSGGAPHDHGRSADLLAVIGIALAAGIMFGGSTVLGLDGFADSIGAAIAVLVAASPRALCLSSAAVEAIGGPPEKARHIMRRNFEWAYACNALAVLAAALGWLPPAGAATAAAFAPLIVLWNSLRLRGR